MALGAQGLGQLPPGGAEPGRSGHHTAQAGREAVGISARALRQSAVVGPAPGEAAQLLGHRVATLRLVVQQVRVVRQTKSSDRFSRRRVRSGGPIGLGHVRTERGRLAREIRKSRQTSRGRGLPRFGDAHVHRRGPGQRDRRPEAPRAPVCQATSDA